MDTAKRTNQGGSVAIFLVVAIILAAGVIGGMYVLQKRGASVRTNDPVAQQPAQKDTTADDKKAAEQKAQDDAAKKKQTEQQAADAQKRAEADKQAAAAKAEADKQAAAAQQAQNSSSTSSSSTAAASNLPKTGPEEFLPQAIAGISLLTAVGIYLKSYQYRFGSLRK